MYYNECMCEYFLKYSLSIFYFAYEIINKIIFIFYNSNRN